MHEFGQAKAVSATDSLVYLRRIGEYKMWSRINRFSKDTIGDSDIVRLKIIWFAILSFLSGQNLIFAQSSTAVYTAGVSSTDRNFTTLQGNSTCPIPLSVTIPVGAVIIGTDVTYAMSAFGSAWMSEQRSQLRCVSPGGTSETALATGAGNATGTFNYNRTGLFIANGVAGGGTINFQLHAGRTFGGSGCGTNNNRVENNWSITVYYVMPEDCEGTPTAGFISLDRTTGCTGLSMDLHVSSTGFTDYFQYAGVSFQWQFSLDGTSAWTDIAGATDPNLLTYSTSSTIYFRLVATCVNSGQSHTSSIVSYITNDCEGYNINEHTTVTTCQGLFYDSGGPTGNYGNYETHTITFCSDNGEHVQVEFLSFNTETNGLFGVDEIRYDILNVYDGPNASSPQLFSFAGVSGGGDEVPLVISSGTCLTFVFTSNGSTVRPGWEAIVSCTSNTNNVATNFCETAPNICNLNGYVGSTSNFYNVENVNGQIGNSSSLFPSSILDNNSFITFTPTETSVTLDLLLENCSGGTSSLQYYGIQFAVYSGTNCSNFALVSPTTYVTPGIQPGNHSITLNNLTPGQTYYIMTDGLWGAVCDYTINVESGIDLPTIDVDFATICSGESITITADGGASYAWSGPGVDGNTSNSISVTQEAVYQVTVESGNPACPNSEVLTSTIIVEDCGCEVTASNSGDICPGGDFTLTADAAPGATFVWLGQGVDGNTSSVISDLTTLVTPGIYTFEVTAAIGGATCSSTTEITVFDAPNLIIDASSTEICAGESVELIASGGTDYNWNNALGSGFAQTVAPNTTTIYNVTDNSVVGCPAIASIEIVVNPLPTVMAGNDTTICQGSSILLAASGADTYTWDNGVVDGVSIFPAETTTYTVIGTTDFGCENTDAITVTVIEGASGNENHQMDLSTAEFCAGEQVILTASGGESYNWTGNGVDGLTTESVTVSQTGEYIVTITSGTGVCAYITSHTAIVTVHPNPIVNAGQDFSICEGQQVVLSASGAQTYTWDNGVINGQPFVPEGTGTYTVVGVSDEGCVGTDEVLITVVSDITVDFVALNTQGCAPLLVEFTNLSTAASVECLWDFGDGSISSNCSSVQHEFSQPGCYDITLMVTSSDGCSGMHTIDSYVCVDENPIANFAVNSTELDTDNPTIELTNLSSGATEYDWSFGDGGASNEFSPTYTYDEEEGNYVISLVVYSDAGCKDSIAQFIQVTEELIYYVPNAFTPNGDKFNTVFQPVFTSGFDIYDYNLLVFNRWGEVVFESNNASVGWDGTYGGNPAPDGVYIWKIRFGTKKDDDQVELHGHVNLIR